MAMAMRLRDPGCVTLKNHNRHLAKFTNDHLALPVTLRLSIFAFIVCAMLMLMPMATTPVEGARMVNTFSGGASEIELTMIGGEISTFDVEVLADLTATSAALNLTSLTLEFDTMFVLGAGSPSTGQGLDNSGDVNNDGFNDLLVSTPQQGNGRMDVLYGTATGITFNNPTTVSGTAANEFMGWDVSTGGDLNGDNYNDVVGGAIEMDFTTSTGTDVGTVHIVWGTNRPNTTADMTLSVGNTGDMFGYSVSTHGDVNNDGYDDLVVGAPRHIQNQNNAGRAYVFLGGPSGPGSTANTTLIGTQGGDMFGAIVYICGDVNGDDYDDVLVSAPSHNGSTGNEWDIGKAYLYYGESDGVNSTPAWTFTGTDHTREYVPLLVYRPGHPGVNLGIRRGFYDIAQSLAGCFGLDPTQVSLPKFLVNYPSTAERASWILLGLCG